MAAPPGGELKGSEYVETLKGEAGAAGACSDAEHGRGRRPWSPAVASEPIDCVQRDIEAIGGPSPALHLSLHLAHPNHCPLPASSPCPSCDHADVEMEVGAWPERLAS